MSERMPPSRGSFADSIPRAPDSQVKILEGNQNSMNLPQIGSADGAFGTSRFSKALKDPNWRSRSSDSGTDHDMIIGSGHGVSSSGPRPRAYRKCQERNKLTKEVIEKIDENTSPHGSTGTVTREDPSAACHTGERFSISKQIAEDDFHRQINRSAKKKGLMPENQGFSSIKRHVPIPGLPVGGPPMSLIKLEMVTPHDLQSVPNKAQSLIDRSSLAKVMHIPGSATARDGAPSTIKSKGLGAARSTETKDAIPGKRGRSSRGAYAGFAQRTGLGAQEDTQRSLTEDPGTMIETKDLEKTQVKSESFNAFQEHIVGPQQCKPIPHPARYERLLLKLKGAHISAPNPNEVVYRKTKQHERAFPTSQDAGYRWKQPMLDGSRRGSYQKFSSDTGYASLSTHAGRSTRSVSEQSSEVCKAFPNRSGPNQFNPRARDFLPLMGSQEPSADQDSTRNPASSGSHTLQSTNASNSFTPGYVGPHGMPDFLSAMLPALRGLAPFYPLATNLAEGVNWPLGIDLPHLSALGLTHMASSVQSLAPGNTSTVPGPGSTPAPTVQHARGPVEPFHHQIDRTILPALWSVPVAYGPEVNPYYGQSGQMYGPQYPLYAPSNPMPGPPRPVRKPRSPNAMAQNEYEAWIEHQKAINPGYALECRLRQQQRAQRKIQSKSKESSTRKTEFETAFSKGGVQITGDKPPHMESSCVNHKDG